MPAFAFCGRHGPCSLRCDGRRVPGWAWYAITVSLVWTLGDVRAMLGWRATLRFFLCVFPAHTALPPATALHRVPLCLYSRAAPVLHCLPLNATFPLYRMGLWLSMVLRLRFYVCLFSRLIAWFWTGSVVVLSFLYRCPADCHTRYPHRAGYAPLLPLPCMPLPSPFGSLLFFLGLHTCAPAVPAAPAAVTAELQPDPTLRATWITFTMPGPLDVVRPLRATGYRTVAAGGRVLGYRVCLDRHAYLLLCRSFLPLFVGISRLFGSMPLLWTDAGSPPLPPTLPLRRTTSAFHKRSTLPGISFSDVNTTADYTALRHPALFLCWTLLRVSRLLRFGGTSWLGGHSSAYLRYARA